MLPMFIDLCVYMHGEIDLHFLVVLVRFATIGWFLWTACSLYDSSNCYFIGDIV
jgi:hypothetical protein